MRVFLMVSFKTCQKEIPTHQKETELPKMALHLCVITAGALGVLLQSSRSGGPDFTPSSQDDLACFLLPC